MSYSYTIINLIIPKKFNFNCTVKEVEEREFHSREEIKSIYSKYFLTVRLS